MSAILEVVGLLSGDAIIIGSEDRVTHPYRLTRSSPLSYSLLASSLEPVFYTAFSGWPYPSLPREAFERSASQS